MVERVPACIRKKADLLTKLFEMIFWHMTQIEEEITEEWVKPPEGFNEDLEEDEDFETTRFGMNAIDRLISSVGEKESLPKVSATVGQLLGHSDWRYQFAALMALSQVGEYIDEISEVVPIVETLLNFLNNKNAKLRYASCHALG
jgi:hypothetical protein